MTIDPHTVGTARGVRRAVSVVIRERTIVAGTLISFAAFAVALLVLIGLAVRANR